ncbi:class I SAM-dependent methyltransferase [Leptodesmis sichuanensis]|uniref:class I SAM-dependent methyltransferase n=1 Tax=Leptodesmis sichuanensis TaxID=2906798 RepID=UPI001F46B1BE|nr:class I SAM-dependent methyltransferase [Leptodesmis sichuanensis]UIE39285.1 class I SAM-dependent methyltransferase [Leptodesmis sichuanensis A121]
MPESLTKLAYQAFQQSKSYFGLAHKTVSSQLLNWLAPPPEKRGKPLPMELLLKIQQRLDDILEVDWQDAERGVYPVSLLFENDWEDFFRFYPLVCVDLPLMWNRANDRRYQDFSSDIDISTYPAYYLQNFHHQTDGYLSDWSANLYDLQVDILFNGTADAMRRRVLAPLKQGLQQFSDVSSNQIRILDVACGTGRTLKFIRRSQPQASLYGVDLSPAYLRKANQLLSQNPGELPQLLQANAEALPYVNDYFHGLTCVFLFHELPPTARQNVINECFRVLKPGGVFVICDSIQLSDSPEFELSMENFPLLFHEPYYRSYIQDDLASRLRSAGFSNITEEVHFMSKYWIAHKPAAMSEADQRIDEKQLVEQNV